MQIYTNIYELMDPKLLLLKNKPKTAIIHQSINPNNNKNDSLIKTRICGELLLINEEKYKYTLLLNICISNDQQSYLFFFK